MTPAGATAVRPGDEGNDAALDAVRDMAESDDSGLWATGFENNLAPVINTKLNTPHPVADNYFRIVLLGRNHRRAMFWVFVSRSTFKEIE